MRSWYTERERLFAEQGGWDKYNPDLISQGGGVFNRSDKSITLTPEMQSAFAIDADSLTPDN